MMQGPDLSWWGACCSNRDADVGERAAHVTLGTVRGSLADHARRVRGQAVEGIWAAEGALVRTRRLARRTDVDAELGERAAGL